MTSEHEHSLPYSVSRIRRTTVSFFATKAVTAPFNVLIFLIISTSLAKSEFALYAWLLAFGQMAEWLSYVGVNWVAVHYIPVYRSQIGGRQYVRFVWGLVAIRYALLAVIVVSCFLAAPALLAGFGQQDWIRPLHVYLLLLAADAGVKFLRLSVFESLLEHGAAQRNVLLQHLLVLALLLALHRITGGLTIELVLWARIAATAIALAVATAQLARFVQPWAIGGGTAVAPDRRTLIVFALDNYTQDVLRILSDGPVVTLLASRLVGISALAQFGFAGNLTEFLSRILPTNLFLGLLRPRLIANYGSDAAFERLRGDVALLLKISLLLLAAVVTGLAAIGRPVLGMLANGKYADSYGLLLFFLLWLGLGCVRAMQQVLCNVLGHSRFLRRAAVSSLLVVPAAVALVAAGAGAYGLVLGMIAGETLCVLLVALQLRQRDYQLRIDISGHARICGAVLAGAAAGRSIASLLATTWWATGLAGTIALAVFAIVIRVLRPFDARERSAIERLAGRRMVFL